MGINFHEINEKTSAASKALDNNDLSEANRLINDIDKELPSISDTMIAAQVRANLGGLMIDLGSLERDAARVEQGTKYSVDGFSVLPKEKHLVQHYYNAANGFSALWKFRSDQSFKEGRLDNSYLEAKRLYREAIDLANIQLVSRDRDMYHQLLINYANCYDSVGRSIEAVQLYDRVIRIDPLMGMALGNKGITLSSLAPLAHGYSHTFYLEAHRLLSEALEKQLHIKARDKFIKYLDFVNSVIDEHGELYPEKTHNSKPMSAFHDFLRQFCLKHDLFLTPTTLAGTKQGAVFGDPLFISTMVAPLNDNTKFDRFITYLNQIKQDYVLARYLLVQSQYKSDFVEAVDDGVALFYPLDYSLHSSYIQMLKTSFRLAVDVLDKIAFFVRDYHGVNSIEKRNVSFRNMFSPKSAPLNLRPELANRNNPFLFALLDMSLDLREGGYYEIFHKRRNALTHRLLVVHDIMIRRNEIQNDIPRIYLDDFLRECIQIMQIARAAVIYLILMVDFDEKRLSIEDRYGIIHGTPVDGVFRWVPPHQSS